MSRLEMRQKKTKAKEERPVHRKEMRETVKTRGRKGSKGMRRMENVGPSRIVGGEA